jgi:hypothetical protein
VTAAVLSSMTAGALPPPTATSVVLTSAVRLRRPAPMKPSCGGIRRTRKRIFS